MNSVVLGASAGVDFGQIFTTLALVLIVAKIAAELCERVRIPAVLGEIVAGILIGPSALGLVEPSDALRILAEVGVIVLLAEVGLEMDLDELRRVGRSSMLVAIIGVVVPMSSGIAAGSLLGESLNASLFLGAALAATSVGITARVFGDLKALSSTEARIVLGAAVADDVLGLIILTVVTRVVEQGSIDVAGLLSTIGLAIGFLVIAGGVGLVVLPRLLKWIGVRAASPVTVGVVAAGITFAFSAAASGAKLAPIIGAFVAGTALARTEYHDRIARDFAVLGSIFIPVFFMQIGIDTDVTKFFDGHVLFVAAILSFIAIAGKMISAVGAIGTNTDKLVIGFGMIPRGEVGLIFASIGVSIGVFKDDLYAVVLLMVLVTTVVTPPLLRWRIQKTSITSSSDEVEPTDEPVGGWLRVSNDEIQLHGTPPQHLVLPLALEAATHAANAQPNSDLLDWMHNNRTAPLTWTRESSELFVTLLSRGNGRSWRFLEVNNVLDRALPEVEKALASRRGDTSELNPTHLAQTPVIESLRKAVSHATDSDTALLLAAFVADFSDVSDASSVLERLVIDETIKQEAQALLSASVLLHKACTTEPFEADTRLYAQLAALLGNPLMVERCRMLTEARGSLQEWQYTVLLEITTSIQSLLAHPELLEGSEDSIVAVRRRDAIALTNSPNVIDRIRLASPVYVMAHEASALVRHASLLDPAPQPRSVRVAVYPTLSPNEWQVDIAAHDAQGLLARFCAVLTDNNVQIVNADVATWSDGMVLDSFLVSSTQEPDASGLASALNAILKKKVAAPNRLIQETGSALSFTLDNDAHPWHSVVTVRGTDQPGLIRSVTAAFAKARISVHHARITTTDGVVADRFEVSTRHGQKINAATLQKVRNLLS